MSSAILILGLTALLIWEKTRRWKAQEERDELQRQVARLRSELRTKS